MIFILLSGCTPEFTPMFPLNQAYTTPLLGEESSANSATIEELGVGFVVLSNRTEAGVFITAWWEHSNTGLQKIENDESIDLGAYTLRMEFDGVFTPHETQSDLIVVFPTAMLDSPDPQRPRPSPVLSETGEIWQWGAKQTGIFSGMEDPTILESFIGENNEMHQLPVQLESDQTSLWLSSLLVEEPK